MAIASLAIMYCLNLALSNGGIKPFELRNPTSASSVAMGYYFTPDLLTSENEFYIKKGYDIDSRLDFIHQRTWTKQANVWAVKYYPSDSVSITINGIKVPEYEYVELNEGDKIRFRYKNMSKPLNFVYGKCSPMNEIANTKETHTLPSVSQEKSTRNDHLLKESSRVPGHIEITKDHDTNDGPSSTSEIKIKITLDYGGWRCVYEKYENMSKPLNFVFGKCPPMNAIANTNETHTLPSVNQEPFTMNYPLWTKSRRVQGHIENTKDPDTNEGPSSTSKIKIKITLDLKKLKSAKQY